MSPPNDAVPAESRRPVSVTNFGLNMIGVVGAMIALYVLRSRHFQFLANGKADPLAGSNGVLIVCASAVVPIIALDVLVLRVHRRSSTGIDWEKQPTPDWRRCLTKLLGLGLTLGLVALAYFIFPEYHGDFYNTFYQTLRRFWLSLAVMAVFYVWLVDQQMVDPYDAYWQLGRVVLGRFSDAKRADIANHFRGWLVKAFYLPLFIVYTHGQLNGLINFDLSTANVSNLRFYDFLNDLVYGLDVLFATVGYVLSFRVIDTHLRTAEPTMVGWVVALECYDPFWRGLFQRMYLHYEGVGFGAWLTDHVTLRWVWVAMILACDSVYVLATFAFGVRFSNLTHRGILTNGPYRFTKHPAYVAKNLSWWLISLPFITYPSHGWIEAIRSSVALAGVNIIYFLRAKTEERHLSRDPTYVAYALWMNDHGLLRFLNRVPLLKYKPPPSLKTSQSPSPESVIPG